MHDLVNFYGSVNNDNITTDPVWLAQMKRAFELWSSLDLEQVDVWLQDLAQALQQSRFDEEYQRLLPQGLDKLVEATLLLIGVGDISVNSEQARRSIESMLSVILEGNDPLSGIRWMQEIAEAAACQRVVGVCQLLAPSPFWLVWKALYWDPFKNAWDQFLSLFVNPRTQQLSEDGYLASLAIMHIVTNMAKIYCRLLL